MFTGLIQHLGRVVTVQSSSGGAALSIDAQGWQHEPQPGESIAVNGCCLTLVPIQSSGVKSSGGSLHFDVIRQTLATTALGDLKAGDTVNLERAVTPQTMLGGHIVQGHVDAIGVVSKVKRDQAESRVRIAAPAEAMTCIVERGSVAVNGVSLTVAEVDEDWFEVALIPTTLRLTNLGSLGQGARVNLETDYIAKIVVNWLRRSAC